MKLLQKIKIEDIEGKSFKIKHFEGYENRKASFTHYIHNYKNGTSNYFKKDAVSFVKYNLEISYPNDNISLKVAENALQKYLFEFKNDVPFPDPQKPLFKFIDLFAGIGGFRIAMQNLQGKCVFTSEWDKDAKKTYELNFGDVPFGDITKEEIKKFIPNDFDILCAGFPCQAFSIAGNQKGFSDTRGTLFFEIEKIVENKRPKVVFLENVKNLQSHDKGNTFRTMIDVIENKLRYKTFFKILNSMTHSNVPQNRERIFIVAFDPKQVRNCRNFEFPHEIPLTKTIHEFIEKGKKADTFYYKKEHKYFPELEQKMLSKNTVYQWRRIYVRENKSNVCPTLTANMGAGGHNVPLIIDDFGIRKLTPSECFAFQGYPMEKFKIPKIANSKLYMQAGNSVTISLVERIAQQIINIL